MSENNKLNTNEQLMLIREKKDMYARIMSTTPNDQARADALRFFSIYSAKEKELTKKRGKV